ncbi:MAG: polyprenyl synthetase family protein [Candidatus Thorarchaeota archaeon]|nr:polyprenyl synthetase family protein [Candidatus Thorarchaeota archaeon]
MTGKDAASPKEGEQPTLEKFLEKEELQSLMALVNIEIAKFVEQLEGEPKPLYDAARYLLAAGGKRLRSLVVLLACKAVGGRIENALPHAVATEIVQTASLIHDDLIDEDGIRRGVETAHRKFGAKMAILAGDLLIAKAVKMFGEYGTPELLANLGSSGTNMVEGEAADLIMSTANFEKISIQEYLYMVGLKTASFMKEAARVGAVAGDASAEQVQALMGFAEQLGFAFQIKDDILNITSTQDILGKPVLSDLKERRCNYVLIHAFENSTDEERRTHLRSLETGDLSRVYSLIERKRSLEAAQELASAYVERAKIHLAHTELQNSELLITLAEYTVSRVK